MQYFIFSLDLVVKKMPPQSPTGLFSVSQRYIKKDHCSKNTKGQSTGVHCPAVICPHRQEAGKRSKQTALSVCIHKRSPQDL